MCVCPDINKITFDEKSTVWLNSESETIGKEVTAEKYRLSLEQVMIDRLTRDTVERPLIILTNRQFQTNGQHNFSPFDIDL